jgi:hypothetical protein
MKKGDKVVMLLSGPGGETASLHTVVKIVRGDIVIDGIDTQRFDRSTGRPINPEIIPGFLRRIVPLET